MILLLLLEAVSAAKSGLTMYGNWSDSTILDEVDLFMEYLLPDYISKLKPKLQLISADSNDTNMILEACASVLPPHFLGLLNLSLIYRVFNPRASIERPMKGKKPVLRGWSAAINDPVTGIDLNLFQYRLIAAAYQHDNPVKHLVKLTNHFSLFSKEKAQLDRKLYDYFTQLNVPPTTDSNIQGRVLSSDPIDLIHDLLEEYQIKRIAKRIKLNDTRLFFSPIREYIYDYVKPLDSKQYLIHHLTDFERLNWPNQFNLKINNYYEFLGVRPNIVDVQIFLNSSMVDETLAILDMLLEETKNAFPHRYQVFLLCDIDNRTERRKAFAYERLCDDIGIRNACQFLFNAIKTGNWAKEYAKMNPETKWDQLNNLYRSGEVYKRVTNTQKYAKLVGIKGSAISVNGRFIKEKPAFHFIKTYIFDAAREIQEAARKGIVNCESNFPAWMEYAHIKTNTVEPPIEISDKNLISIVNLPINTVIRFIKSLMTISPNSKSNAIPVIFINYEFQPSDKVRVRYVSRHAYGTQLDESCKKILNIESDTEEATIVGNLIFHHKLNENQLDYALQYVHLVYLDNVEATNNNIQLFYGLLFRAATKLRGSNRRPYITVQSPYYIETKATDDKLVWNLIIDPLSEEFRPVGRFAELALDSGATGLHFYPCIQNIQYDELPNHLHQRVYHIDVTDSTPKAFKDCQIFSNSNWAKERKNNNIYVNGIASFGFSDSTDYIMVEDQLKKPLQDNNYFVTLLKPGIHETKGLNHEYCLDSLISYPHYFRNTKNKLNIKEDTQLNIFTYISNVNEINRAKTLLYSLTSQTKVSYKIWSIDGWNSMMPNNLNHTILPKFWPHFLTKPYFGIDLYPNAAKHVLLDLFLPPNLKHVLVINENVVIKGDVSRFLKINMSNCAAAAAIIPSKGDLYFDDIELRIARQNRPYHSDKLLFVNLMNWNNQHGGDWIRKIFQFVILDHLPFYDFSTDLFNRIQLFVQVLTLSPELIFDYRLNEPSLSSKAFAHVLSDETSVNYVDGYKKMQSDALKAF